jgi:ATP-binding cassette subfamily F protein uup
MSAPNVLMLDEPTNDLDIQTLVRLEEYFDSFAGCLIVVSHDRYFLDRTVEHVFRLEDGGRVREYPGNYSAFLEAREREAAESIEATKAVKPVAIAKQSAGTRKLSYKERREFEELEKRIEDAEARKLAIERQLIESASDFVLVQALYTELESLKQQLDEDVDRWAELAEFA